MEAKDYQNSMLEVISIIKDKAAYLKSIDGTSNEFNRDYYEGMKMTYHLILDGIKTYIECNEDLSLEEFGLQKFDPNEIIDYQPNEK